MRDEEMVQRAECNTGKIQACPEAGALGRELQRRGKSQEIFRRKKWPDFVTT